MFQVLLGIVAIIDLMGFFCGKTKPGDNFYVSGGTTMLSPPYLLCSIAV